MDIATVQNFLLKYFQKEEGFFCNSLMYNFTLKPQVYFMNIHRLHRCVTWDKHWEAAKIPGHNLCSQLLMSTRENRKEFKRR